MDKILMWMAGIIIVLGLTALTLLALYILVMVMFKFMNWLHTTR